jgi:diacylglycerol kinase (ATP)
VIAAGGDGTVGAVADQLANSGTVLLVMPLGTSNDFARSLQIPMNLEAAAALLSRGKVSTIDLGRLDVAGQRSRHFVHAATVGLNVSFAKLATRASFRRRLGRLTYVVAAAVAVRERRAFNCRLTSDGQTESLPLAQLSVINAPVFGDLLGLRVQGSDPNDLQLDVLAVEDLPSLRTILAGLYQLVRLKRPLKGVHSSHTVDLMVEADEQLEVALDGEIAGSFRADSSWLDRHSVSSRPECSGMSRGELHLQTSGVNPSARRRSKVFLRNGSMRWNSCEK